MDLARLGTVFRAIRLKKRLRQVDVASTAGVSRAAVSRLEQGHARELGIDELLNIAEGLGVQLRIVAAWRGGDLDRLINGKHSALHESVARAAAQWDGWVIAPEVSYSIYGERGVIDLLCWHQATQTLLVIELKTEIVDVNELMGKVDQKRRLAPEIARKRGWHPLRGSCLGRRCREQHQQAPRGEASRPSFGPHFRRASGRSMTGWPARAGSSRP